MKKNSLGIINNKAFRTLKKAEVDMQGGYVFRRTGCIY